MPKRLIVKNVNELITCQGSFPRTGPAMAELGIIANGAVVAEEGLISYIGPTESIPYEMENGHCEIIDGTGKCVLPGLIDAHTHFVFGGCRAEEFSWRLRGISYAEIMQRGGGIVNTVKATRESAYNDLKVLAKKRLDTMLAMGVTTVEGKSGYGLDANTELKQLQVMADLNEEHAVDVISTFMGAHAIPPDYRERTDEYVDYVITHVLPVVAEKKLAQFCDVFCERGIFSVEQSRRLLTAAVQLGLQAKLHADEIYPLGGAELAAEVGAVSADHLLKASNEGLLAMAKAQVVATLLPATAFSLKEPYARARYMIDNGVPVALATDFNPGSCPTQSIPLIIALAALYLEMSPAEIVTALTVNAAAAVGRADRIGSLAVGKQADMVILEYPSHIYLPYHLCMNIVETVIKKGHVVFQNREEKKYE